MNQRVSVANDCLILMKKPYVSEENDKAFW